MRRLFLLALFALAVFAVPAVAQTADSTTASASCTEPGDSATLMVAAGSDDGGVGADPSGADGSSSGGTPAVWDGGTTDGTETPVGDAAVAGDTATGAADTPGAVVAQEPEPEPEGPGEEQPGDPDAEQPPPIDTPEVPGGEAPAGEAPVGETGGGLPRTGIEVLQLALLGVVLFLVGARIRVLALRRRKQAPGAGPDGARSTRRPDPEPRYDDDFDEPAHWPAGHAHDFDDSAPVPTRYAAARDEWSFPDPSEPAPTGLLPSTASARRHAREVAMSGDRE